MCDSHCNHLLKPTYELNLQHEPCQPGNIPSKTMECMLTTYMQAAVPSVPEGGSLSGLIIAQSRNASFSGRSGGPGDSGMNLALNTGGSFQSNDSFIFTQVSRDVQECSYLYGLPSFNPHFPLTFDPASCQLPSNTRVGVHLPSSRPWHNLNTAVLRCLTDRTECSLACR